MNINPVNSNNYIDRPPSERREVERFKIEKLITTCLHTINETTYEGFLWDISSKGLCICFKEDISNYIQEHDIFRFTITPINTALCIDGVVEIRWITTNPQEETSFVGGRFIDVDEKIEAPLLQLIALFTTD